jgi:hypothetical protein
VTRLLPIVGEAESIEITLFANAPLPHLPVAIEAYPLNSLAEHLTWFDFIALDINLEQPPDLVNLFGFKTEETPPCPIQVLLYAPMPCGGLAECGVCALPVKGDTWKLVCQDGPVFDLQELE